MPRLVIVLSGRICAGKSTLAESLVASFAVKRVKTQDCLRKKIASHATMSRQELQLAGEKLDRQTRGAWVGEALREIVDGFDSPEEAIVLVDSVRIAKQIEFIRNAYGRRVVHVHLTAPTEVLATRYATRTQTDITEFPTYAEVQNNKTEAGVEKLLQIADVVVDTNRCTRDDVVVRVAAHVGLYGRDYPRLVDVFVGGQFGSEGKGQVVAHLANEYDVLVRVGGPNAGHTVFEEPKPYTFHHLPSGTRANPAAKLIIGAGAVLYVPNLMKEIAECQVEAGRLTIDPQAMIISDSDRAKEEALTAAIGSTGQGVGYATARKILGRSDSSTKLARDIPELRPFIGDTCTVMERCFRDRKRFLLEGTQGTGLSIHHGFYPHVTSRDTTVAGCLAEAGISPSRVNKVILVCRTYPIRVRSPEGGTSGPMSQEIEWSDVESRAGFADNELKHIELTSTTRRQRRVSEFDWALLRKAASLNAPTDIALTFVDYLSKENQKARRFEQLTDETIRFIDEIERVAAAPVSLISTRFHSRAIIDRRAW